MMFYTHGNMLCAHFIPKIQSVSSPCWSFRTRPKQLYNGFTDSLRYFVDKTSFLNVEKLFQCRIYTTDIIASKGVSVIKNNNYEPLIESVSHSEGFSEKNRTATN